MNRKCLWMGIVCLLLSWTGRGQEIMPAAWQHYLEQLADDGEEEMAEEMTELWEALRENPASLNDTLHPLEGMPFVSDLQRECLKAYIALYGELLTFEELYAVNGFDSMTVELLRPIATARPPEREGGLALRELLAHGSSNLVTGIGGTVEQARGYREDIYEGDNLRMMWRYSFKYKERISLQLSGDKDPGEAFFSGSQRQGFDFYGYSLVANDIGRYGCDGRERRRGTYIQRMALGQYHAQFGQGLTLWSGFGTRYSWGAEICRYAPGLRTNGAFTEYGYLNGAAATIALAPRWAATLIYSCTDRDATLPSRAASDSTIDWVQSLYSSGYHRTQTEIGKQGQLGERLMGGRLEYRSPELKAGLTGAATLLEKEIVPASYVYNGNAFRGRWNANAGADFAYRHRRLLLFGEAALCMNYALDSMMPNISPAAIAGAELIFNNSHRISSQAHYYSPYYHNLHATALGLNSTPQNELGAGISYQGRLPWGIMATASAEHAYFPHEKYLVYGPSHATECRLTLSRESRRIEGLSASLRYRYKDKGRNVTPSRMVDGAYLLEQTYRHQLQGDVEYRSGAWKIATRIAYAHYHGDVTEADGGLMVYQDVQYHPQGLPLTVAARAAWFDVDDYEARLYMAESDFVYQSNSTAMMNEGFRGYLVLKYEINGHWNIGAKYGLTLYTDRDTFGSGYDLIDGNCRQQWRIQMRLKW